jgi:hypothetical protein
MDVRVDAERSKSADAAPAASAEIPEKLAPAAARAPLSLRLVLAIAAAVATAALALGLGLGLGLKRASASSKPKPTGFNFKGVYSLAMAAPRSGRRLGASEAATTLLALSSSGNASAVEAPEGVIQYIFASPTIATVLVYWPGQPLYVGAVACILAHVASDGVPVCIQPLGSGSNTGYCLLGNVNMYLPLIQFSPAGNVYYQCATPAGGLSVNMFSATAKRTTVVIPAPASFTSGYRLTAWAVVNDATGSVVAGLQDQASNQAKGTTALYSVADGSSATIYSKDVPRFMLTMAGGLFIGYLANGPVTGGLKKLNPQNATGFEAAQLWIGFSADSPSFSSQVVMPTAASGGMDFMAWAMLESGHTIVGSWTASQSRPLTSGTTVDAYGRLNGPRSNLLLECVCPEGVGAPRHGRDP